jgi:hypothetical protein
MNAQEKWKQRYQMFSTCFVKRGKRDDRFHMRMVRREAALERIVARQAREIEALSADKLVMSLRIEALQAPNYTCRKCRAECATVLEVIGAEVGVSIHDGKTEYRVGETVHCDKWDDNRWNECGGGIHFFITRYEAEHYS